MTGRHRKKLIGVSREVFGPSFKALVDPLDLTKAIVADAAPACGETVGWRHAD